MSPVHLVPGHGHWSVVTLALRGRRSRAMTSSNCTRYAKACARGSNLTVVSGCVVPCRCHLDGQVMFGYSEKANHRQTYPTRAARWTGQATGGNRRRRDLCGTGRLDRAFGGTCRCRSVRALRAHAGNGPAGHQWQIPH